MHRTPAPPSSPRTVLTLAVLLALTTAAAALAQPADRASEVRMPLRGQAPAQLPTAVDRPILDLSGGTAAVDAPLAHLDHSIAARRHVQIGPTGEEVVGVIIRGTAATSALRGMGVDVQSEAGEFRTARVPLSVLPALVRLPGVERLTLGYGVRPQLDVSVPETNVDKKRAQQPPLYGWYAKNVIVGLVDSGVDYQHDDFRNPDGSTRFLSIWDQNTYGTPPSAFGYGNECSAAQIAAGTCTETDPDGHGSHVMGIAAGDGSATGNYEPQYIFTGLANGAQLVAVATDFSFQGVIDGVNYVFQKAAALGRPAVVNLSLGTGLGPHDGTTDFELALDALTGAGKIIVASAGNGQADLAHASRSISSAAAFNFTVPTYTPLLGSGNDAVVLDLWHAAASVYQVRVQRPTGPTLVGPVSKGSSASYSTVDGNIVIDYTNSNDPNGNGQAEIAVEINDVMGTAPRAGAWQIQLTPVGTPAAPLVHAWTESYIGSSGAAAYFSANVDTTVNVSSPATASNVIAVAAYTSKRYWASVDGSIYYFTGAVDPYQICAFSARGPRRDGVLKPEIAAPGSAIVSVLSGDASPPYGDPLIAPDGVHLAQQGTSMSAPHVTGAAAMLLQSTPTLTPASLKAQLAGAARSSAYMGTVPNARWGAGKLDVGSLLCSDIAAPVVAVTHPQSGNTLYTGTLISLNWTATDDYGVTAVDLEYHVGAAGAWTPIATGVPNNNGYFEWTVPGVITDQMQIRVTAHDCIGTAVALSPFVPVRAPSVGVPSDLPLAFAAYRSTPNPFSSAATLRFDLPAAPDGQWPVDVSIFNVAGRRVRTVVKSDLPPGRYSYEWDGRSDSGAPVSAGIYFLRISAGENEARQRLIYLR